MASTNTDSYNLALDALQAGRTEDALLAVEDALVEDPKDVEAWQLYILILNLSGRSDDAKRASGKLKDLGISEADSLAMQAMEAMAAGDAAAAAGMYQAAIALEPGRIELHASLALALWEVGDRDAALDASARAVGQAPDDPQSNYLFGRLLRLSGRNEDALAALTRALELDPGLMLAVYEQGMVLAEANDLESAAANFERFLAAHPDDESATRALTAVRARMVRTF